MANKSGNILSNTNEKTIETNELIIEGHLLRWENVTVQISNISSVTAWSLQPPAFPQNPQQQTQQNPQQQQQQQPQQNPQQNPQPQQQPQNRTQTGGIGLDLPPWMRTK